MENKTKYYLDKSPIVRTGWGLLTYRGPMLTEEHTDLLFTLLLLAARRQGGLPDEGGSKTFVYSGSMRELLIAAGHLQPNAEQYDVAFDLLSDMVCAVISHWVDGKRVSFSKMIFSGEFDGEEGFTVHIGAEFMKAYQDGHITRQTFSDLFSSQP
jgi:hypothetical protein